MHGMISPPRLVPGLGTYVCAFASVLLCPILSLAQTTPPARALVPAATSEAPAVVPLPAPPTGDPPVGVRIGPHAMVITLSEAVQRAESQSPTVRTAIAGVLGADANVGVARSAYFPTVRAQGDGNLAYRNSPTLFINPVTMNAESTRISSSGASADAQVNAGMTLWDFGRTMYNVESAHHAVTNARETLASTIRTTVLTAAVAYLTVLGDRELIASVLVTLHQREQHLAISTGLVAAGSHPPIEQVRSQVDLESSRLDLANAQATEETDRAALASALGIDPVEEIDVVPISDNALRSDDDPRRAAEEAVNTRPEFHAARARLASAQAALASARAGRYPVLSASANATGSYNEVFSGFAISGMSASVSGGVTMMVPLMDVSVGANIQVADANVETARESLDAETLAVRTDAVQSALAVRGAQASLDQAVRLQYESAQNLSLAEGRYQGGAAPLLELVDAQAADETARVQVVRARFALHVARVRLLAAVSGLDALAHVQ